MDSGGFLPFGISISQTVLKNNRRDQNSIIQLEQQDFLQHNTEGSVYLSFIWLVDLLNHEVKASSE
jgi:hypothetical protein